MNEGFPKVEQELTPERYLAIAERLSGYTEAIPFQGLEAEAYKKLKAESDEFPGFATPIDALITRFQTEGIKIVIENGKAFVLPFNSNDVENDSVFPRFLNIADGMDTNLKTLIRAGKQPG
jgi:hypothetical protein